MGDRVGSLGGFLDISGPMFEKVEQAVRAEGAGRDPTDLEDGDDKMEGNRR